MSGYLPRDLPPRPRPQGISTICSSREPLDASGNRGFSGNINNNDGSLFVGFADNALWEYCE